MIHIKTLLAGLTGGSLCLANISGVVMDTGTTPISGAVVQLKKGGQTATTGADGSFTLVVSTAILPGNSKLPANGLSARISGNLMTVTLAERSAVEVVIFDISGKVLLTVRKMLDAGCHYVSLPYRGTGISLYKMKAGNREFVLKGNPVAGVSYGNPLTTQGSLSIHLAKQAKTTAAIEDVITATKTGYLNYRAVAYSYDTTGIAINMIASAGTVTDVDGNEYHTVKIGNQVWTVENLRVTKYNDGSTIQLDTSVVTWKNSKTPKYCYYKNTTDSEFIKKYGALYNWYVVSSANPKKIAPAGWHMPTDGEWDILLNYLIGKGYNWDGTITGNKIAKSLAAQTEWGNTYPDTGTIGCDVNKNNASGFSALPGGSRDSVYTIAQGYAGYWWSSTDLLTAGAWYRFLFEGTNYMDKFIADKYWGYSVRLLKDN